MNQKTVKRLKTGDLVFRLQDGFYAYVDEGTYGPWVCAEYARAGMQVERRRADIKLQHKNHEA